jgi:hypothetical protein
MSRVSTMAQLMVTKYQQIIHLIKTNIGQKGIRDVTMKFSLHINNNI